MNHFIKIYVITTPKIRGIEKNPNNYSFEIKFEQKHLVNPYFTINKKNPF